MVSVGVAIPSIPPRGALLARALKSVSEQTHPVDQIAVAYDLHREGAGATRNRAKAMITAEWTAFLDDDDEFMPHHIASLLHHATATGADMVFPWFDVVGGTDPIAVCEAVEWNTATPHHVPVTVLIRTELAHAVDYPVYASAAHCSNEEQGWLYRLISMGAQIEKLHQRTWLYHHDSGNTSGMPSRW